MAGIDKTYTDSFKEYSEFKEWSKDKTILFPTGQKIEVSNYIYDEWEEEDFVRELPIMNSPTYLDIYLIQNCPFEFIQNRMRDVYGEESYTEFKNMIFPTPLSSKLKQNRKVVIKKATRNKFPLYNKGVGSHSWWWLQSKTLGWNFDSYSKVWVEGKFYPNDTNTSTHKTIKSLVRFLRKQYLPSGLEFNLSGRYVGEEFIIVVK